MKKEMKNSIYQKNNDIWDIERKWEEIIEVERRNNNNMEIKQE